MKILKFTNNRVRLKCTKYNCNLSATATVFLPASTMVASDRVDVPDSTHPLTHTYTNMFIMAGSVYWVRNTPHTLGLTAMYIKYNCNLSTTAT